MATTENWVEVGSLGWFYREADPIGRTDRSPVLLLHGLISQSYSWRDVMPALAEQGFRTIAPDWIGCGFSDKPDRRDFAYTPEVLLNALEAFINTVELKKFSLVAQGFLGSVGIQYALRHPQQVERLAILNAPISQTVKLPWKLKQMSIPLVGDMLTQNPLLVDRILEGAGGYRITDRDMDVYRRPWIKSSDAGRALMATLQNLQLPQVTAEIETGLTQWNQPLLLAWGVRDPWLPMAIAQTISQFHKTAEFVALEEVGHYPQEDWHEKVSDSLVTFLRRR
ncbi:hydrolase [Phormidesmis priestleyi ULC007]|uniref:Hydrolase n=1 Tax=Phormidesmis priestleyi ULC007 TaxID=1920490 RepID=A0A2T1DI29_9CYAN|nr:alpha/beta fold hydrolase [Phormidesmis priestleyi]PSB20094.1 hydrolase [Phormidesmis priestleyi ULC007]PZO48958.1 MAG: hydrolase [Phormidesmis priestleyi]